MKGKRYLEGVPTEVAYAILRKLPFMSIEAALEFYETQARTPGFAKSNIERFLAANDRFYLLAFILRRRDAISEWVYDRCREVEADPEDHLDLWSRAHYKDLDETTPVLTTRGWKPHGQLRPGDFVFGANGQPTKVLAVRHFSDSICRRITFDNGISFVCGAGHLWTVKRTSKARIPGEKSRRENWRTVTVETDAIAELIETTPYRPVVPIALPLQTPEADLPLDPYVLGVWLGDGTSGHPYVTAGLQDADAMEALLASTGVRVHRRTHSNAVTLCLGTGRTGDRGSSDVANALRALGIYRSKAIPDVYMLASVGQRLALLQGLIDTDGSASPDNGCITFAQRDRGLAEQVQTLANGLGFKARLTPVRAGTGSWHVVFQASREQRPCRLPRKLAALPDRPRLLGSRAWRIRSIDATETVPTNCIQVDNEDGLYLVGRELVPTHNSTIITFAGSIQEIINDPDITIAIFGNTFDVAKPFLEQIARELEENEYLKALFPDVFWEDPRNEAPAWSKKDGIVVRRKANPKELTVQAFGLMESLPTGGHWRLRIYNDIVTYKSVTETDSDQQGKTTERWELSQNLGTTEGARRWHEGTRYSYSDLYSTIIDRNALKLRIYPATHDGTLNGKPVFLSSEKWEEIKRDQRSTVSAQMLLNPIAGNENTFFVKYLRPFTLRPRALNVYIIGDPAASPRKGSDRTAIVAIGVDRAGNRYLLDGYCHKMRLSEKFDNVLAMFRKWKGAPGVEMVRVAWERYGMQTDLEYFEEKIAQLKVDQLSFDEVSWVREGGQSKKARIGRLEPYFRNSQFYIPPKVLHPDHGVSLWSIHIDQEALVVNGQPVTDAKTGAVVMVDVEGSARLAYRPYQPNKLEIAAKAAGEGYRIMEPIRRIDQDGVPYDVVRLMMEEYRLHPFAPHDDFMDAMSRIQDVDATPPMESGALKALESPLYID